MGVALCLRFDRQTTELVEGLWRRLADSGVRADMLGLGYPPHLTLVMTNDQVSVRDLASWPAGLVGDVPGAISLGAVRSFPGTHVVYLSCEGDLTALRNLQRLAADGVPPEAVHEHYRPETWTPHVTLQTSGDVARAMEVVGPHWPGAAIAVPVTLDLVTFPPTAIRTSVDVRVG